MSNSVISMVRPGSQLNLKSQEKVYKKVISRSFYLCMKEVISRIHLTVTQFWKHFYFTFLAGVVGWKT